MDRPFGAIVVRLLQNEGAIVETIAESFALVRKLRSFFLLGGCGLYNQQQEDG